VVKKKLLRAYATSVSNYFDDLPEKFWRNGPIHIRLNFSFLFKIIICLILLISF